MTRRSKPLNVLVGPMRPLVAGGAYDPAFHTFERLRGSGLGVSYEALTLANQARFVHRLVPMAYDERPRARRRR